MTALTGLRARFHEPGSLYSAQMLLPEPAVATILGSAGFDYVMVDAEHGPFTLASLRSCVEAFRSTSAAVVVRTASQSEVEIKQCLDLGIDGVMTPRVESAEEAAAVISAARYPPEGTRGLSRAVRAARYGLDGATYAGGANASIAVLAIVESARGVENVEEIVAVPGLDGVMVGGDDLSADLGLLGRPDDGRLLEAIDIVVRSALAAGVKVLKAGSEAESPAHCDSWIVHCFLDAIGLADAARQALDGARASA
jgi:2-dehydro-3-deoxyglucarate aldolase/4-hydroxy-2-oxoheptanedioate aldolase